jgi:hypothetical protein
MITEKSYLKAKKIIVEYENQQLNKPVVKSWFIRLKDWYNRACDAIIDSVDWNWVE